MHDIILKDRKVTSKYIHIAGADVDLDDVGLVHSRPLTSKYFGWCRPEYSEVIFVCCNTCGLH